MSRSIPTSSLRTCGKRFDTAEMLVTEKVQRCDCGGLIRPDVVWFGENLPEAALAHLAQEGIKFTVEGPASYEQLASLRNPSPAEVQ